jgi:hypothetical protein
MPPAIQIRQTGGPEVLHWTPIEVGEPGPGQVRLRQAAFGPQELVFGTTQGGGSASLGTAFFMQP